MADSEEHEDIVWDMEEDADLRAAAQETWGFWHNPVDDAVWNEGGEADKGLPQGETPWSSAESARTCAP